MHQIWPTPAQFSRSEQLQQLFKYHLSISPSSNPIYNPSHGKSLYLPVCPSVCLQLNAAPGRHTATCWGGLWVHGKLRGCQICQARGQFISRVCLHHPNASRTGRLGPVCLSGVPCWIHRSLQQSPVVLQCKFPGWISTFLWQKDRCFVKVKVQDARLCCHLVFKSCHWKWAITFILWMWSQSYYLLIRQNTPTKYWSTPTK